MADITQSSAADASAPRRRRRLFGFHRANETHIDLENTGSIHIWAVAVCTDKATHWSMASFAAAALLALVVLQLAVLAIVLTEAAYPGCSAHTECRFGEHCSIWKDGGGHNLSMPRCSDCLFTNTSWNPINTIECELLLGVGQRLVPWGDDFQPWDRIDHTKLELTDPLLDHDAERTRIDCLAWLHCSETDVMPDRCDYLVLNARTLHVSRILLLAFLALLFAVPLCEDIDSALTEEALLDHQLRDKRMSQMLSARTLRFGLRFRRFWLPWFASTAALAVIVTSPFSAKDMLLNLLAIAFITEADDMLAMLLSPAERRRPDKALEEMRKNGVVVGGMVFARLVALACSV